MSRVDISVVVSTYQRRAALRRTLDSLLGQRVPSDLRYEIIVVDNNCTDGTREMVGGYMRRRPELVRYETESRQGVSYGRNAGILAARGRIVAFTDDDNAAASTWLATIAELMRNHPDVAGVGGKVVAEWPPTRPAWLDRRHWSPLAILDYGERAFFTSAQRPLCLLTANLAIRRDVLLNLGGFSPDLPRCQDHDLLLRLWRSGDRVLYSPELVTFAPIDQERMTRQYHRRWHARHGHHAATMRLEEATDASGRLRARPPDTPRLLGSPGYIYADAGRHVWQWALATIRGDRARAAHYEHRVRYLAAYIRNTARLSRSVRPPLLKECTAFAHAHLKRRASAVNMTPVRVLVAHAVVAVILAGSAYDIVTGKEHWPFSPYPMFSGTERSATLDSLLLRGVPDEDGTLEIPLREASFITPFDQCRLTTAMQRARSSDASGARLHLMLEDCLSRYEAERRSGKHDGPPLRALRVYDAHWTLDGRAGNVDAPDAARLVDEVVAPVPAAVARNGQ